MCEQKASKVKFNIKPCDVESKSNNHNIKYKWDENQIRLFQYHRIHFYNIE